METLDGLEAEKDGGQRKGKGKEVDKMRTARTFPLPAILYTDEIMKTKTKNKTNNCILAEFYN